MSLSEDGIIRSTCVSCSGPSTQGSSSSLEHMWELNLCVLHKDYTCTSARDVNGGLDICVLASRETPVSTCDAN